MGCVSSTHREGNAVENDQGKDADVPIQHERDDVKLETATSQRRRLSIAPVLVGDVDGIRINPSEGTARRLSLGPSLTDDTELNPVSVSRPPAQTEPWIALSKKGHVPYNRRKTNQDAYFIEESLIGTSSLYGVCDGHGEFGHHVSAFVKTNFGRCLKAQAALIESPQEYIPTAIIQLCRELKESPINISFSGTTLVFALKIDKTIVCGNIGDSRCIILRRSGTELIPIVLTRDQKPDDPDEKLRILSAGGRVRPLPGPINEDMGPNRVWLSDIDVPGLAMSRSIGDEVSHTVGVISDPEVHTYSLTDADLFLVLASDGVWEFLSNDKIADMVANSIQDLESAAVLVVQESTRKWQEVEEVIDDITFVILQLQPGPIVLE